MPKNINYKIEFDFESIFLPVYYHLQSSTSRVKFIYGGRDSGKSRDAAMRYIIKCLSQKYFRCILVRKTFNSIKDSQWQLIKDITEEWGISHLFKFNSAPLEIKCKNGNKFICRGMDDPAKIKSINDPSDCWVEEGNQLTQKDWIYIITTLRSNKGPVNIDMTFNTECVGDFNDFWLYKEYFSHTSEKSFTHTTTISVGTKNIPFTYTAVHTTYHDNPYCSDERIAFHEALKELNYYWYKVFTLGEWGNEENDAPWLFAFDRTRHVARQELFAEKREILYLSFDFNRNPAACVVIQWDKAKQKVKIIDVIKIPNVGTEGICEVILMRYPGYLYVVTGDHSGANASSIHKEHVTNYTMIKKMLRLNDKQIQIQPNPKLEKNRTLVNAVFYGYDIQICPVKGKPAIFDCENVKTYATGQIVKEDREDPKQQADVLDCIRYFINKFMSWFVKSEAPADFTKRAKTLEKYNETKKASMMQPGDLGQLPGSLNLPKLKSELSADTIAKAMSGVDVCDDAVKAIENGVQVICTKHDYNSAVRDAILIEAGKWVDKGDAVHASLALMEVQRLDARFDVKL